MKINLLKGGDLCVFNNHGNFSGHATKEDRMRFNKGISLHTVCLEVVCGALFIALMLAGFKQRLFFTIIIVRDLRACHQTN